MNNVTDCISSNVKNKASNVIEDFGNKVSAEISSLKSRKDLTDSDRRFIEFAENHVRMMKMYIYSNLQECKK